MNSSDGGRFRIIAAKFFIVGRNVQETLTEPVIVVHIACHVSVGHGGCMNDAFPHTTAIAIATGVGGRNVCPTRMNANLCFLPANGTDRLPIMASMRFGAISPPTIAWAS